ncbi:Methyltransferase domain protein [Pirellulimonas nuda]|uniref:Methyltransferase domain protein n=1 Tax=Pirellulimonas nuda TaxID=2528009 RepID=A0A518DEE2_9BACT|nr:methyltransferase [Pirellulimonas nuda]QDU89837.1 Methyltransferase domain protein [Pirellulimonas nuda]
MPGDRRLFWRQFRSQFHTTGAVAPSSRWLAKELCRYAPPPTAGAPPRRWLEAGPGSGSVTDRLIRRLGPADRLDLVEINAAFVATLQERLATAPHWRAVAPRVRVFHQPLEDFAPEAPYDAVVAGLPLNNFTVGEVAAVLQRFADLLTPGGSASYFEYLAVRWLKIRVGAKQARPRLIELDRFLRPTLSEVSFDRRRVWWNLPPAVVHHCRFPAGWRACMDGPPAPSDLT